MPRPYKDPEGDGEVGLPWAIANAPSPFMREVARIANARGDSLGKIGKAKGSATNVISGHFDREPREATRAWYAEHYGIGEEYAALVEGCPFSDGRLRHWTMIVEREYSTVRFKQGTLASLRAAWAARPKVYCKAIEAYALDWYREYTGIYKGSGRFGTMVVHVGPGWLGRPSDVAFVREMRPAIDLVRYRRQSPPVDRVLSEIALRLDGNLSGTQTNAVLEVVRAMLRANGHDLTYAEALLSDTLAALRQPQEGKPTK